MSDHWHKAQEEARRASGTNIVFSQDAQGRDIALVGNPSLGWRIVTPEGIVGTNMAHGVECVFEELHISFQGWH
jgi:hypothetical protein